METKILLQDLAEFLSQNNGITKKKAETFVRAFFDIILSGLESDKFVKIKGFGTFKMVAVGERESVNINTGERFQIQGHTKVSFTPDPNLKDLVNRPFSHFQTVILNEETTIEELESISTEELPEPATEDTIIDLKEEMADSHEMPEEIVSNKKVEIKAIQNSDEESKDAQDTNQLEITNTDQQASASTDTGAYNGDDACETQEGEYHLGINAENTQNTQTAENDNEDTTENADVDASVNTDEHRTEGETTCDDSTIIDSTENTDETNTLDNEDKDLDAKNVSTTNTADEPISDSENESEEGGNSCYSNTSTESQSKTSNEVEVASDAKEQPRYIVCEPVKEKFNWWKVFALTLLTIILMTVSYFVGYFRLLCPCTILDQDAETIEYVNTTTTKDSVELKNNPTDSLSVENTNITSPDIPTAENEIKAYTITQTNPAQHTKYLADNNSQTQKVVKVSQHENTVQLNQVEGGKYQITGTRQTYKVGRGETIRTIALQIYGSKGYAPYIIAHNHLKNPDNINIGSVIKLPELALR